jgi:hypothetical protein
MFIQKTLRKFPIDCHDTARERSDKLKMLSQELFFEANSRGSISLHNTIWNRIA